MAERRMFAKSIIDSDAFIDMPLSAQALYFHLCMRSDDDGFNGSAKHIQRMIGASDDDFKLLLAKRFVIPFETGVIVIKHWKIHNYIQADRYIETNYLDEKRMLGIKANKAYTLLAENDECTPLPVGKDRKKQMDTKCIHDGYMMDTQVSIDKNSKDKRSKEKQTKGNELNDVLDLFSINGELREAFNDFIKMRKEKKKPLTPRALKMVINRLLEMSESDITRLAILNQSILHNWDTVYELKDNNQKQQQTQPVVDDSNPWKGLMSFDDI